jgi:hypothetical protein
LVFSLRQAQGRLLRQAQGTKVIRWLSRVEAEKQIFQSVISPILKAVEAEKLGVVVI